LPAHVASFPARIASFPAAVDRGPSERGPTLFTVYIMFKKQRVAPAPVDGATDRI
jgi:hypothetical protein